MLTDTEIKKILDQLDNCKRPLYLFDDDPDGLCSFLLLYRYVKEGKGIVVKTAHNIGRNFINKVVNYEPDKIFILDIAQIEQSFVDEVKRKTNSPIIIIDHHSPINIKDVEYYNPQKHDPNAKNPVSLLCYKIVKTDMWISVVGTVSDWIIHPDIDEFRLKYPNILPENIKTPEEALFNSRLGELIKFYFFILKGDNREVLKCIKILTRIESPYEILDQTTPRGKYIYKRAMVNNRQYEKIKKKAIESVDKEDSILLFRYDESDTSFSAYLSNELVYRYPDKMIIVARHSDDEFKCSLRGNHNIPEILKKSLLDVEGYGGGHLHACGCCVKVRDFDRFLDNMRTELSKSQ